MGMENTDNAFEQKRENCKQDITDRCEGNRGVLKILSTLLRDKGPDVYEKVAPNLGRGGDVWLKYKDECGEDLDTLIEKYG
jgi:hypothetical protein